MSADGSALIITKILTANSATALIPQSVCIARSHPSLGLVDLVDTHGGLHTVKLGDDGTPASVIASYQVQLSTDGGFTQPVRKAWSTLAHLPDDGLLLAQAGSSRIMFASLPPLPGESAALFLFGAHEGPVLCLAANGRYLASGGADGCVRLWGLDSGEQLDAAAAAAGPGGAQVTAVAFAGPLMVAAGTSTGHICVFDASTHRLRAVQRFYADAGPISALAARLTPRQLAAAATAAAPRGLDGGGVVAGPGGLPWRLADPAYGGEGGGTDAQLAAASSAGWLHVYAAAGRGEGAWRSVRAGAVAGAPHLAYSPDGGYLAVASGAVNGQLVVLDAESMRAVHERHFASPLAGAGFLPDGAALVAASRGASVGGGLRLRLFAAPSRGPPELVQLTVPLYEPGTADQEAAEDEDFLSWLQHKATAPAPTAAPTAGDLHGTASGRHPAASPPPPLPGPGGPWASLTSRPPRSPLGPVRAAEPGAAAAPHGTGAAGWLAPEPWSSPQQAATAPGSSPLGVAAARDGGASWDGPSPQTRAAAGAGAAGAGAAAGLAGDSPGRTWQAYRPTTLPAPRSWLSGLPPRTDLLQQLLLAGTHSGAAPPSEGPAAAARPAPAAAPRTGAAVALVPASEEGGAAAAWQPRWRAADRAGYNAGGAGAGDSAGTDGEPEMPHSGALLPASEATVAAATGKSRYAAAGLYNDEQEGGDSMEPPGPRSLPVQVQGPDQDALASGAEGGHLGMGHDPHADWEGNGAQPYGLGDSLSMSRSLEDPTSGVASGVASWRGGDLTMGDGFFGGMTSTRRGSVATAAPTAPPFGASFRFQPLQPPGSASLTQTAQLRPVNDAGPRGAEAADAMAGAATDADTGAGAAPGMHSSGGGWSFGGVAALERTAYLGADLAALGLGEGWSETAGEPDPDHSQSAPSWKRLLQHGAQSAGLEDPTWPASSGSREQGGGRRQEESEQDRYDEWQHRTLLGGGIAEPDAELAPRSADSVPRPQRPRAETPPPHSHYSYEEQQAYGTGDAGEDRPGPASATESVGDAVEEPSSSGAADTGAGGDAYGGPREARNPPAARRPHGDAGPDPTDTSPSPSPAPASPAASQAGSGLRGHGRAAAGRSSSQPMGEHGAWAGWANGDVLSGPARPLAGAATRAADSSKAAVGRAPQPRQPPPAAQHRMQLSDSLAPSAQGRRQPHSHYGAATLTPQARARHPGELHAASQPRARAAGAAAAAEEDGPEPQPLPRPALVFRGFKPSHAKIMQMLRRKPPAQPPGGGGGAAQVLLVRHEEGRQGAGAGSDGEPALACRTPAAGWHRDESPAASLLQSPAVLLGSPSSSAAASAATVTAFAAGAASRAPQQRQRPRQGAGHDAQAPAAGVDSSNRQHLLHLRQQRAQQHEQRRRYAVQQPWSGADSAAGSTAGEAPTPDVLSSCGEACGNGEGEDVPGPIGSDSPWVGAAAGAARRGGPAAQGEEEEVDVIRRQGDPRSPPRAPVFGSTLLLLKKMQALEGVLAQETPVVAAAASRPMGRGGAAAPHGPGADGGLAAAAAASGMNEAQWEEAARRAATAAANVAPGSSLYRQLPEVDAAPQQQPRVSKQLHPGWVASRQARPELSTLWQSHDCTKEMYNTRGIALYTPPTPAEVAAQMLELSWS